MAREIARNATEPHLMPITSNRARRLLSLAGNESSEDSESHDVSWPEIARFASNPEQLLKQAIPQSELYLTASRVLSASIQTSGQKWQDSADNFVRKTTPALHSRIDALRAKVNNDLDAMAGEAANEADELSKDLVAVQRLRVRHVVDNIEKLLRRRRRRFRWVRRGGWLAVEWLLVGFMWYVWFIVMIARVILGIFKGIVGGARWLLWL